MRDSLACGFTRFMGWLPLRLIHALATVFGMLAAAWFSHSRAACVSRVNLRLCFPDLAEAELQRLWRDSLIESAKTFLESGALWHGRCDKVMALARQVSGREYLLQPLQRGQPVVLLTPHLGSWEMAGLYASSLCRITSLYLPIRRMPRLDTLVQQGREHCGARLVAADGQGLRALSAALQRGEVAGILPDHEPTQSGKGVFAPFFGVAAFTTPLVPRLAQKNQAAVVFTYAERLPHGQGFYIHYLPAPPEIYSENQEVAVAALNRGIEDCARRCPAQYLWGYKRFKTRPQGQAGVYGVCR
jgi:KDO2-lipid IV(A) lauroyltransferase